MSQNILNIKTNEKPTKSHYVTVPTSIKFKLEDYLSALFESELHKEDSVLLDYNPFVVKKIAGYLSGKIKMPASIGIAGETASGKSTITRDLIDTIEAFATEFGISDVITRVNTDDYYYDRSEMVKAAGSFSEFAKNYDLDSPEALELELMCKHIKELLSGNIISEGLFTLTDKVRNAFDFKIYVDIPEELKKERFFVRAAERGLGESAEHIYKNANEKADVYIKPCKATADIVLSGAADRIEYKNFLNKIIRIVQDLYFV